MIFLFYSNLIKILKFCFFSFQNKMLSILMIGGKYTFVVFKKPKNKIKFFFWEKIRIKS